MNINDVIDKVIKILGFENLTYDSEDSRVAELFDCANYVYSELTSRYVDLRKVERMNFRNSVVNYSEFSEPVREILKVNVGSQSKRFTMYPEFLACAGYEGEAYVEYLYLGKTLQKGSTLDIPPFVTEYVLATGIASEYYFRHGYVDEANYYKSKYDNSVVDISRKLRGYVIPARRFLC